MKNYELLFVWEYDDGYSAGIGGKMSRIIATDSDENALLIGNAMVGEEYGDGGWLARLESCLPTEALPSIPSTLDNRELWQRVMKRLGYTPYTVCFWYDVDLKNIIGIYPWSARAA